MEVDDGWRVMPGSTDGSRSGIHLFIHSKLTTPDAQVKKTHPQDEQNRRLRSSSQKNQGR
jgi:hypothetical protein